jgi:hypothetical protein
MTKYTVHLYRKMELTFVGILAETPQAAAEIAAGRQTDEADNVEDCTGANLAAVVDVSGYEDVCPSVTIDFAGERQRKAAAALLEALEGVLVYAENEALSLEAHKDSPEAVAEAERAWQAVEAAQTAVALAKPLIPPLVPPALSRFEIENDPLDNPNRAYVLVDGKFDVAITRTDDSIVIKVYPRDWIDPIDTLTVWDAEVAEASAEAEADDAREA